MSRSGGPNRPVRARGANPFPTGAYILLVRVRSSRALHIGRLGRLHFARGNYAYIGSGMGGLEARVARHFREDKKVKWHIDRLLAVAELSGAALFPSKRRTECRLARAVLAVPGARVVPGFGSSDCRCPGHLAFLGAIPFGKLLGRLDGRVQGSGSRVQGRTRVQGSGSRANGGPVATLNPVPCTLSLPCTLNPEPSPSPCTLNPVPCTLIREALH